MRQSYPENPVYNALRDSDKHHRPLLPIPQPAVEIEDGILSRGAFAEAIHRAVTLGYEERTFLFACPRGASLIYGQFGTGSAVHSTAYCVTHALVPSLSSDWLEGRDFRRAEGSSRIFPAVARYVRNLTHRIEHSMQIPGAAPLDLDLLAQEYVRRQDPLRYQLGLSVGLDTTGQPEVIDTQDLSRLLREGSIGVFESSVYYPEKNWTTEDAPVDWSRQTLARVWHGMKTAIVGATAIADRINQKLGISAENDGEGVTVAIPLLSEEARTHPLHKKLVPETGHELARDMRWHVARALPPSGISFEEALAKILNGETL